MFMFMPWGHQTCALDICNEDLKVLTNMANITKGHHLSLLSVTSVYLCIFDIVFQGQQKYGKWCPVTWSHTVINHKSVSWMVTVMWPIEDSEGWAKPWPNLSRPFEIEQIMHNDIISNCCQQVCILYLDCLLRNG